MLKDEIVALTIAVVPTLALACVMALLSGCSSAPVQTTTRPYCNTSQEIRTKNGTNVSSETLVKCNDDPVEQIVIKKAGMAQNCGWVSNPITLPGGRTVNEAYISCLASNGRWVRIDPH